MYKFASSQKQNSFRSNSPLTFAEIQRHAPSVVATSAHSSRAETYGFIGTGDVLDALGREGFKPYEVRQTLVRRPDHREHTRHMVRLRRGHQITSDSEVPELILLNSHDGTSSYQLMAGYFRFVCSNGLISGDVTNDVRIRHSGNVVDNVIEGATRVLDNLALADESIKEFKGTVLTGQEQRAFADAALTLRWDEGKAPIPVERLLIPRRHQDGGKDMWSTFNVVQEKLLTGGVVGRASTGRRMTTRAVGGVSENVKLNRALWSLARGMLDLKSGNGAEAFIAAHEASFA